MKRIKNTVLVSSLVALAACAAAGGSRSCATAVSPGGSRCCATAVSQAMENLLDGYVSAGRIAGVVSVLSDADYNVQFDCVGWAERE